MQQPSPAGASRSHGSGIPSTDSTIDLSAPCAINQSCRLGVRQSACALGPRSTDAERSRDVICRLHRYSHKGMILRQAWEAGDIDFERARVPILPDLFRATLQQRVLMRPLPERIRQLGCTYWCGFPHCPQRVGFLHSASPGGFTGALHFPGN